MTTDLLESVENGIATLTFNRPEARNALTQEMYPVLMEALPRLGADPDVRVIVITGAGGAFCAGGDVKNFAAAADGDGPAGYDFNQKVDGLRFRMQVAELIHKSPKPVIAAIPGPAAGAGLSIALAADMRIAVDTAKLTTAFAKVGLSGDFGGSYFLTKLVGTAKARELYFTGKVLTATEAEELGIVNKAVPADQYEAAVKEMATQIASMPTIALGFMKKNLNKALFDDLEQVLDWEAVHMMSCFDTEDHKGAAKAFVEKKAPVFKGR
ncbi:enoyl-CoA hydratase [Sneathiella sp. P13V-1]|uniref:enoyl-CoA hydratase-related protein n=1 Tax=Sneathiella sp. P13V-1 TaxID=2697366 RepID=UPI00187B4DBF|nr:enoyl-CoA hydratase-related protein [Sneathiella sp. P13V-1]MBE7638005.1 enoyl-CoA hydratase [Sneathiella sp. P13V-1]